MQMGHVHAHTQEKHQAAQFLLENRKCTFAEVSFGAYIHHIVDSTVVGRVRARSAQENFPIKLAKAAKVRSQNEP